MPTPLADALKQEEELWGRLHAVLLRLTPEIADRPGYFQEGWTAKDAVAHIGTWMAYGAAMLRRIAAGTYRESEIDVDAENARFLSAMRDIPLETVHVQASAARSQLLAAWHELKELTPGGGVLAAQGRAGPRGRAPAAPGRVGGGARRGGERRAEPLAERGSRLALTLGFRQPIV